MHDRVHELKQLADVVIFDGPAVLPIADAVILGSVCDGVVMVVDAARTRPELAKQAKDRLDRAGVELLGVILNKTASSGTGGYYARARAARVPLWPRLAALWSGVLGGR
jgi:Mrp family chromosome partitioning ATPase